MHEVDFIKFVSKKLMWLRMQLSRTIVGSPKVVVNRKYQEDIYLLVTLVSLIFYNFLFYCTIPNL